jgi:hypothetical protein
VVERREAHTPRFFNNDPPVVWLAGGPLIHFVAAGSRHTDPVILRVLCLANAIAAATAR